MHCEPPTLTDLSIHLVFVPFNLTRRVNGMAFSIVGILIHDEVDIAMVGVGQCCTLDYVQPIDLVLINTSNCTPPV